MNSPNDIEIDQLVHDIDDLLQGNDAMPGITPNLDNIMVPDEVPLAVPVDNREYYWKQLGQCPECADGTVPDCVGGSFVCPKCDWTNG